MNNGIQPTVELATNNGNGFAYPYPVMSGFGGNGGFGFGGDGAIWIILIIGLNYGTKVNSQKVLDQELSICLVLVIVVNHL